LTLFGSVASPVKFRQNQLRFGPLFVKIVNKLLSFQKFVTLGDFFPAAMPQHDEIVQNKVIDCKHQCLPIKIEMPSKEVDDILDGSLFEDLADNKDQSIKRYPVDQKAIQVTFESIVEVALKFSKFISHWKLFKAFEECFSDIKDLVFHVDEAEGQQDSIVH
jgi:hypothetical protein